MKQEALTSKTEHSDRQKVGAVVLDYRKKLHREIVKKMMELKFCTSPEIIECFKRRYLFDCHNVETSRALDLAGLKNAVKMLGTLDARFMLRSILLHYKKLEHERELLRCTSGQIGKMQAVGIYQLKLKREALEDYAKTTLKREVSLYDMSIEEAHQVIKRLEEWEAKVLLGKKCKAEVSNEKK